MILLYVKSNKFFLKSVLFLFLGKSKISLKNYANNFIILNATNLLFVTIYHFFNQSGKVARNNSFPGGESSDSVNLNPSTVFKHIPCTLTFRLIDISSLMHFLKAPLINYSRIIFTFPVTL